MGNFVKKFNPLTPFKVTHNIGKNLLGGNLKGAFNASNPFYKAPGGNVPPPAMGAPGIPGMEGGMPGGATPGLLESAISGISGMQEGAGMPGAMPEMSREDKIARRAGIAANRAGKGKGAGVVGGLGVAPGAGGGINPGMVTNKLGMF